MLKLAVRRGVGKVPTLLGVMLVALFLVDLMPGDPAAVMAGESATPEAVEKIRQDLRIDDPAPERLARYLWGVLHGDLGTSPLTHTSVWERISASLPATLSIAAFAMVLAAVLGIAGGTAAALRPNGWSDRIITAAAAVFQAVPPFVLALVLVVLLAIDRAWFPTNGYVPLGQDPGEWARHLVLPGVALGLGSAAELIRQTRGAMVDVLEQDHIRATRAKGLAERRVVAKHAAKNAAVPVVTVLGLQLGRVLGGAVIVELIFGIHGFGELALDAVVTRDVVLIQGVVLVSAVAVLLVNVVVDLSYGYFNPKVRV